MSAIIDVLPIEEPRNSANILRKNRKYHVAVVDDDWRDFKLLEMGLMGLCVSQMDYYQSLDDFLAEDAPTPDVAIIDRYIPGAGLMENSIRRLRARHQNCGVIMHTGHLTPSLRTAAAHQGAFAVIEKGAMNQRELGLLVEAAATVGPSISLPGEAY